MAWDNREPTMKEVIDELYGNMNHIQVADFPEYEPKTRNEYLYVLDRILRILERDGYGKDRQGSRAFQAAKKFVG